MAGEGQYQSQASNDRGKKLEFAIINCDWI